MILWFCFIHDEPIDRYLELIYVKVICFNFASIAVEHRFISGMEIKEDKRPMCEKGGMGMSG